MRDRGPPPCSRSGRQSSLAWRRRAAWSARAVFVAAALRGTCWSPDGAWHSRTVTLPSGPLLQVVQTDGRPSCITVSLASEGVSMEELASNLLKWNCDETQASARKASVKKSRTPGFSHVRTRFLEAWKARTLLVATYETYEWLLQGYVTPRDKPPDADAIQRSMRRLQLKPHSADLSDEDLMAWLRKEYGEKRLQQLTRAVRRSDQDSVTEEVRKLFQWFRDEFPYYRGACENGNQGNFLGLTRPGEAQEAAGRVAVTELYAPANSSQVTEFPRYSSVALPILESRRGRCGEYSVLAMAMLEVVGIPARWVNNHAGHVWAEANIGDRWIHIDPCEAAVDNPLMYAKDWGRAPLHVLAYGREPWQDAAEASGSPANDSNLLPGIRVVVEDVTEEYRPDDAPPVANATQEAVREALEKAVQEVAV
eukprot:TRINITY_DN35702_c0_g1_i1.p1 TRINITY_DN35702_c0_g1~~TRINITY_DN35702_c0_g1_i1.p1  ORF type:complete len:424 (-),score=79.28 TRINITY_DN35702_c0_g1_i1:355-1626(-)